MSTPLTDTQKADMFMGIHEDTLSEWNESIAYQLAEAENIVLTDAHFEVLHYIRRCHERFGQIKHARTLTQALATRFGTQGGKRYLYLLFPKGPVTQGCILAGIPAPADSVDLSFGTAA